jgi:hypothetical protein
VDRFRRVSDPCAFHPAKGSPARLGTSGPNGLSERSFWHRPFGYNRRSGACQARQNWSGGRSTSRSAAGKFARRAGRSGPHIEAGDLCAARPRRGAGPIQRRARTATTRHPCAERASSCGWGESGIGRVRRPWRRPTRLTAAEPDEPVPQPHGPRRSVTVSRAAAVRKHRKNRHSFTHDGRGSRSAAGRKCAVARHDLFVRRQGGGFMDTYCPLASWPPIATRLATLSSESDRPGPSVAPPGGWPEDVRLLRDWEACMGHRRLEPRAE